MISIERSIVLRRKILSIGFMQRAACAIKDGLERAWMCGTDRHFNEHCYILLSALPCHQQPQPKQHWNLLLFAHTLYWPRCNTPPWSLHRMPVFVFYLLTAISTDEIVKCRPILSRFCLSTGLAKNNSMRGGEIFARPVNKSHMPTCNSSMSNGMRKLYWLLKFSPMVENDY